MMARKIKKASLDTQDIDRFTLPSPDEPTASPFASALPDTTQEEAFWQAKKGVMWISAFAVLVVLALVAGVLMYKDGTTQPTPLPSIVAEPQVSPTPTTEAINLSAYTIEVLNGSGISGEAARIKALLEREGFTVASIGNAEEPNYTDTVIQIKKDTPEAFLTGLKANLKQSHVLKVGEVLTDQAESDVIVTIGSSKNGSFE